jgi:hypothetical protein
METTTTARRLRRDRKRWNKQRRRVRVLVCRVRYDVAADMFRSRAGFLSIGEVIRLRCPR